MVGFARLFLYFQKLQRTWASKHGLNRIENLNWNQDKCIIIEKQNSILGIQECQ